MGMSDPVPTFAALAIFIRDRYPDFAYVHVIEPRIDGVTLREARVHESNNFLRDIWEPRPFISAGGYGRDDAIFAAQKKGDLVAFGRHFISNVRHLYVRCAGTN